MKPCPKCGKEKPLTEFALNRSAKDGRQYRCRSCAKAYREENSDRIRAYGALYCARNRETARARAAAWYAANRERALATAAVYRQANALRIMQHNTLCHARKRLDTSRQRAEELYA